MAKYRTTEICSHYWAAVTDDYDGAPDAGPQLVGYGKTEEEALEDLKFVIDERAEA